MTKRAYAIMTLAVLLAGLFMTGCSAVEKIMKYNSSDKEECFLNPDNVTQFTYKGENYTILEETLSDDDLGSWVGYIRKLVVLDAEGNILLQQDAATTTLKTLADIPDTQPDAAYMMPFLNVYACKDETAQELIVNANGENHKAILSDSVTDSDDVFHYNRQQFSTSNNFSVNPHNCMQLLCADKIYQITDEVVPDGQVGEYLDIIAESIVFDKDTKLEIPQKDLDQIDWDGNGISKQQRESWFYGEVHAIQNMEASDFVAVEINAEYRIATSR